MRRLRLNATAAAVAAVSTAGVQLARRRRREALLELPVHGVPQEVLDARVAAHGATEPLEHRIGGDVGGLGRPVAAVLEEGAQRAIGRRAAGGGGR